MSSIRWVLLCISLHFYFKESPNVNGCTYTYRSIIIEKQQLAAQVLINTKDIKL